MTNDTKMNENHLENQQNEMTKRAAFKFVKELFLRNGYLRKRDELKLKIFGAQKYKKGFEVRLYPKEPQEISQLQAAISALDLKVAKTFIKAKRVVQPIYGREIYQKLKKLKRSRKTNKLSPSVVARDVRPMSLS
jgi:hypothetical protein